MMIGFAGGNGNSMKCTFQSSFGFDWSNMFFMLDILPIFLEMFIYRVCIEKIYTPIFEILAGNSNLQVV